MVRYYFDTTEKVWRDTSKPGKKGIVSPDVVNQALQDAYSASHDLLSNSGKISEAIRTLSARGCDQITAFRAGVLLQSARVEIDDTARALIKILVS